MEPILPALGAQSLSHCGNSQGKKDFEMTSSRIIWVGCKSDAKCERHRQKRLCQVELEAEIGVM